MEHLPILLYILFGATTALAILLLFKAAHFSKRLILSVLLWMVLQAALSLTGFYQLTNVMPPRFALLIFPPVLVILLLLLSKKGKVFLDTLNVGTLTLLHIVRIPVELCLFWLYLHKGIPELMTFDGRNFDVFCGISAPVIYYFGYIKKVLNSKIIIAWNMVCLILLANIVVSAVLSAPFPIQQFGFEQPNIALLYFPFTWLPGVVVPIVLFAHLVSIRSLLKKALPKKAIIN